MTSSPDAHRAVVEPAVQSKSFHSIESEHSRLTFPLAPNTLSSINFHPSTSIGGPITFFSLFDSSHFPSENPFFSSNRLSIDFLVYKSLLPSFKATYYHGYRDNKCRTTTVSDVVVDSKFDHSRRSLYSDHGNISHHRTRDITIIIYLDMYGTP